MKKTDPIQLVTKVLTGDKLAALRLAAGLTQEQCGELVGYSRRGWQDMEINRRPVNAAVQAMFLLAISKHPTHKVIEK
jgi:transcriptional regulator with XRE-family HTH domain